MITKITRVFISHPFISDPVGNKKKVDEICKEILSNNTDEKFILPISPLHMFDFVEEETPELRKAILDTCKYMIAFCDELWSYGYSSGCKFETDIANALGVKVYDRMQKI